MTIEQVKYKDVYKGNFNNLLYIFNKYFRNDVDNYIRYDDYFEEDLSLYYDNSTIKKIIYITKYYIYKFGLLCEPYYDWYREMSPGENLESYLVFVKSMSVLELESYNKNPKMIKTLLNVFGIILKPYIKNYSSRYNVFIICYYNEYLYKNHNYIYLTDYYGVLCKLSLCVNMDNIKNKIILVYGKY
jgi:hypothetical protein